MCNMCLSTKSSNRVLLTISDSIAINILNNDNILRGIGNELHLHSKKEGTKVLDIRLKGKIHGIEKGVDSNGNLLLIYGEKEFLILEWNGEHSFNEHYRAKLSDWISTATFLQDEAGFVILTAHSVLLHFRYTLDEDYKEKCTIIERISCADKSTLYCAHLHGKSLKDLVVFGGNAFGELLIWQPINKSITNGKQEVPLLQRLSFHNGVIFSIDYEPKEKLLITTSDDRSISFWRVENQNGWVEANIKAIANGYGHQARVFQGRIIDCEGTTYAITVGEDSNFCLWRCNGDLICKKRIQFGAVIWNLAYSKSTSKIYTIGSTGNMISFNLTDILKEKQSTIPTKLAPANPLDGTEYIAKIKFLTKNQLIGLTNQNRLVINNLKSDSWHIVESFASYKCTLLEVYGNLVALCGYKRLTLFEFNNNTLQNLYDGEVLNGVIRSFHYLNEAQYLLSDELGNCILLERQRLEKPYAIELPSCKERWLTAALLISNTLLLVSNRLGNVMLYQFNVDSNNFELKNILKHPHGYLGSTLLKLVELNDSFAYVQSAGHDSTLKTLCINLKFATVAIANHQIVPVAWIEKSITVDDTDVFLGFNDNHFTVWTKTHDITVQVPCGGGHRCWHFFNYRAESRAQRIKLVFIRNKNVLLYELNLFNECQNIIKLPVRNRWHTRPCNILEIVKQRDQNELITISAGDDNIIKIATLSCNISPATLQQKAEIHTHISNIRSLKVLTNSTNDCLIFSGGGRAQLCATAINLSNFKVTELLSYTLKATLNSLQSTQTHSFDPETRIMSIDVLPNNDTTYSIYLACSDGFLRKLHVDSNFNVRIDKAHYYGKCLLQVRLIADLYLLAGATDGIVSFFNLELTTEFMNLPLHASGINALDINLDSTKQKLHLLTGGDDQAVTYTQICLQDLTRPSVIEKLHLPQLHSAQVTAAKFSKCVRYILTSGVDQNLIQFDLEQRQIVNVTHSCVADIKGLNLDSKNDFYLLYGCGLQIFEK